MKIKILMMLIALITAGAYAFEVGGEQINSSLTLGIKSRRMSKGEVYNPDPVGFAQLNVEWKGLYFKAFVYDAMTDYNEDRGVDRYDIERGEYKLGYNYTFTDIDYIKSLNVDISYIFTDYPSKLSEDANELELKLTTGLPLNPGIEINYDVENDFMYFSPFISYDYVINEKLTLKSELNLYLFNSTHCKDAWGFKDNAFSTLCFSSYLKYDINEVASFGPFVEAAVALDHRVREEFKDSDKNNSSNYLFGVKYSYKF